MCDKELGGVTTWEVRAGECETGDADVSFAGAATHLDPLWMEGLLRCLRRCASTGEKSWQDDREGDMAVPQGCPFEGGTAPRARARAAHLQRAGRAVDQAWINERRNFWRGRS